MQELKSPRGLLAALIIIAVACSLFDVVNRRFSAGTASEISPEDRLNAFLACYVGAQVLVQVPLEVPGYTASISLYDYARYPRWHHLAGEKVVTLLIRSKKVLAKNDQTTQRTMIDLGHDGSLDFVIEGKRGPMDTTVMLDAQDSVREATGPEKSMFAEITTVPRLVATLNQDSYQEILDLIRDRG